MATTMNHLNVSIFDEDDQLTHWRGSPSSSGGTLTMINTTPVGGPPQFDFDSTGNDREPYTFEVETDIVGATKVAQDAFIARYAQGKTFSSDKISGLPTGINFVVQEANVSHNDKEESSKLTIKLHEVGSLDGATPAIVGGG